MDALTRRKFLIASGVLAGGALAGGLTGLTLRELFGTAGDGPDGPVVVHGREDMVIPLSNSLTLSAWIDRSQLHVFGRCGHWTQIEHAARFAKLVSNFLAEADAADSAKA